MPASKKGRKGGRKKKEKSVEISSDNYEFAKQEYILCMHHGQLYKAKVIKRTAEIKAGKEKVLYFVHYHGWNQQWDEWVSYDRCYRNTPENQEKKLQMQQIAKNANAKAKAKVSKTTQSESSAVISQKRKNKKRQIEDSDEEEEEESESDNQNDSNNNNSEYIRALIHKKSELRKQDLDDLDIDNKIKIHQKKKQKLSDEKSESESEEKRRNFKEKTKTITLPTSLKDSLVEQYNLIHSDRKVIKLPKQEKCTINHILESCLNDNKHKLQMKIQNNEGIDEIKAVENVVQILPFINNGLKGFFKNTLRKNLLYNFEKPQLNIIMGNDNGNGNESELDLCAIYGAEHLVRLFYILPNILFHTQGIDESNFGEIKQCVTIIMEFINKNKAQYLIDYNKTDNIEKFAKAVSDQYMISYQQLMSNINK